MFKLSNINIIIGFQDPALVGLYAHKGRAGKPSLLSRTVSPLPIPVVVVVNKPDNFLLRLLAVQWQAQQSPLLLQSAYPAVPLASVFCINICLYQWLYCTEREAEREEEYAPYQCMCHCFLLFWDLGQCGGPPLGLAPPILLLTCCPSLSMHHSVLLLSSSVTGRSLYCHCAFFPLRSLIALSLSLLMFSTFPQLQISSGFFSVSLHVRS